MITQALLLCGLLVFGSDDDARIERVKAALEALRSKQHVPGVSIAVIRDGKVEWEAGFGVRRVGDPAKVDEKTLFQAASISKPVAAIAALRLVERGDLELDRDVNDFLVAWKVPESAAAKGQAVTLRRLLSHSAGLSVHGFAGYFSDQAVPTLLELLDGKLPANSPPIRIALEPGTKTQYSGGGYCVLQQLLLEGSDQEFPELMQELVLAPLAMSSSLYGQPLPESRRGNAASGHSFPPLRPLRGDGFVTHPEMAAAGLWTTAGDLARFAVAVEEAFAGRRPEFLKADTARALLTPQLPVASEGSEGSRPGLGLFLSGSDAHPRFGHGGSNQGFRCEFVAYRDDGLGAAVFTNGDHGGSFTGPALDLIAAEYAWPDWKPGGS